MKNVIKYFYNFNIDNIRMIEDNYYFVYNGQNFVFYEIKDPTLNYQYILQLNNYLLDKSDYAYRIVVNKSKNIVTQVSNKKYVLISSKGIQDRKINYHDISKTNVIVYPNNSKLKIQNQNWDILWKQKIDYFETFINYNSNKYSNLNQYHNYFIGMAENAIEYFKDTINELKQEENDKLVISHKRIERTTTLKDLYNPLTLIVDHPSRDLSEYLKMIFLNDTYQNDEIYNSLEELDLSQYGARLLISRMLYPSFFFDDYEKLINNKISTYDIVFMIDKMHEYEKFVVNIRNKLNNKYSIPIIGWLKKVDYSSTFTTPNTSGTSFISMDSIPSFNVTSIMLQ